MTGFGEPHCSAHNSSQGPLRAASFGPLTFLHGQFPDLPVENDLPHVAVGRLVFAGKFRDPRGFRRFIHPRPIFLGFPSFKIPPFR